ncbi:MAG: hypothetical protein U1E31_02875 [Rickettsiales bacterium]
MKLLKHFFNKNNTKQTLNVAISQPLGQVSELLNLDANLMNLNYKNSSFTNQIISLLIPIVSNYSIANIDLKKLMTNSSNSESNLTSNIKTSLLDLNLNDLLLNSNTIEQVKNIVLSNALNKVLSAIDIKNLIKNYINFNQFNSNQIQNANYDEYYKNKSISLEKEFTISTQQFSPTYLELAKNNYKSCSEEISSGIFTTCAHSIKAGISFAVPLIYSCTMLQNIMPIANFASYFGFTLLPFQKQLIDFGNSKIGKFAHNTVSNFPSQSLKAAGIFTLFGIAEIVNLTTDLAKSTIKSGFYLSKGNFFSLAAITEKIYNYIFNNNIEKKHASNNLDIDKEISEFEILNHFENDNFLDKNISTRTSFSNAARSIANTDLNEKHFKTTNSLFNDNFSEKQLTLSEEITNNTHSQYNQFNYLHQDKYTELDLKNIYEDSFYNEFA